ncbi:MYC binding protein [Aureococcus anophagefferens]|uniref:MYC binding protein n=1 Tax=Aureococcus anophagefferens TaxID=44056 RepID=A0ABR1FT99_AURAN
MAYQTPDSKKEEFRKYLEKSGVIDALTKGGGRLLVGLYEEPERPPNAVDYIKRYMGAPTGIDVEALRQENENARRAASRLRKEREDLRSTIDELNARLTEDKGDDA